MQNKPMLPNDLIETVANALREDIGDGDITAGLIPSEAIAVAVIYSRQDAVLCGIHWVNEVLRQVDPQLRCEWQAHDGNVITSDQALAILSGSARSLLTVERCALNFLQTLSGTATTSRHFANSVAHTNVRLLDTRKTIPGLRTAQKYAVRIGGCHNHRMGLYDAFLIKENHIMACGSITAAIKAAKALSPHKAIEVEVECLEQLQEAINAAADIVMLDNFTLNEMREAVIINDGIVKLEASGGINADTLIPIAETGVDYISIGALTKHCHAVDLSMLFT
jgi:nicotinate-nucleotide pyrophosphorylase (carboxylating)